MLLYTYVMCAGSCVESHSTIMSMCHLGLHVGDAIEIVQMQFFGAPSIRSNRWRREGKYMVGTHNMRSGCFARSWMNILGTCGSEFTTASWIKHSTFLSYAE